MDVNVKHPWHEQLHQLDGLPLVACGGDKRPYQKAWQTKSLTPEQIIAEDCAAVGLRCGEDSGSWPSTLMATLLSTLQSQQGANPMNTALGSENVRTHLIARWCCSRCRKLFWPLLPNKKIDHETKPGGKKACEQVEVFWGNTCQVIVAGKHPSGVFYDWAGTSPADLKPLPPEWLAFWLKLAGEQRQHQHRCCQTRSPT